MNPSECNEHDAPGYQAVYKIAEKVGWPTHYRTDLTNVDRRWLNANPTVPFLWGIRELGTEMYMCRHSEFETWQLWAMHLTYHEEIQWYFWTGDENGTLVGPLLDKEQFGRCMGALTPVERIALPPMAAEVST